MERERITISIRKKVLDQIDKAIDGTNIRNRSHAIEAFTLKSLGDSREEKAVILLGGDNAMKALPATKQYIEKFKSMGFESVILAVGFLGDKIKEKLGDGSDLGIKIEYSDKGEGSGGALLALKKQLNSTFFVVNTPDSSEIDLTFLKNYHRSHQSIATVATSDLKNFDGIYVFEPEVFATFPRGFSMLDEKVLPDLAKAGKLIVLPLE